MASRIERIDRYFPAHEQLRDRFRQEERHFAVDTRDRQHFEAWRRKTRGHLREIAGIDSMQAVDPSPRVTQSIPCDGYVRHRVEIFTEPNVVMTLYALVPDDLKDGEHRPAVIAAHGHGSAGKLSVVGRDDVPMVADAVRQYNYAYGHRLAQRGLVVFAPDARGWGERREPVCQIDDEEHFRSGSCAALNFVAISLGQSLAGMYTLELMRLIDYIQSRNDCDPERIGCVGLSGGGHQTLWLAAMDDRVRAAVVSGYFYGHLEALLDRNDNCACNYVPGLWQAVDMGDMGALIAPRPMLIETGDEDPLNGARGVDNVRDQVEITRKAYVLLHAEHNLVHDVRPGEHQWFGDLAEPWLVEQLTEG